MATRHICEGVLSVSLPPEPQLAHELAAVNQIVSQKGGLDVILDFTRVEIVTSCSMANLVMLDRWLSGVDRRLILCNVRFHTKCAFKIVGLDAILDFADGKADALAALRNTESHSPQDSKRRP
jgi:anti-anti-sigma regulatory factor